MLETPPVIHTSPRGLSAQRTVAAHARPSPLRPDIEELSQRSIVSSLMSRESAFRARLEQVFREPKPPAPTRTRLALAGGAALLSHSTADAEDDEYTDTSSGSDLSSDESEEAAPAPAPASAQHAARPPSNRLQELGALFQLHELAQETIEEDMLRLEADRVVSSLLAGLMRTLPRACAHLTLPRRVPPHARVASPRPPRPCCSPALSPPPRAQTVRTLGHPAYVRHDIASIHHAL